MATPITTLGQYFVRITTGKRAYLYGILPDFRVLLSLGVIMGALTVGSMLLSTVVSVLPAIGLSVVGIFANYWFAREIQSALLGTTFTTKYSNDKPNEVEDLTYDIGLKDQHGEEIQYDLRTAIKHLRGVLKEKYGVSVPKIRLGTFAEHHHKIVVSGRNPGKGMILLSSPGSFHHFEGHPKELNALLLQALAQIQLRATFSGMVLGVAIELSSVLSLLIHSRSPLLNLPGSIISPFAQALMNSLLRTHVHLADKMVTECGYGEDLISALNYLNNPSAIGQIKRLLPPKASLETTSFIRKIGRYFDDILRADSPAGEDKKGYALLEAGDNLVHRICSLAKEFFSTMPRIGHRKTFILEEINQYKKEHDNNSPNRQQPKEKKKYELCDTDQIAELLTQSHDAHGHRHTTPVVFSNVANRRNDAPAPPAPPVPPVPPAPAPRRSARLANR